MDFRVKLWWAMLCGFACINVGLWLGAYAWYQKRLRVEPSFQERRPHLFLSAVYVLGCGFRALLPRADVQRMCLVDSFWSSIAVGRTVATVAELACAVQWFLLAREYGRAAGSRKLFTFSWVILGLIVNAEVWSWFSVLTTNYLGNTIEESCWALMACVVGLCMVEVMKRGGGEALQRRLRLGLLACGVYVSFMVTVDIRMYVGRLLHDIAQGREYLTIPAGAVDISTRWVVSGAWADWAPEMAWMTLYFSAAVWVMISLIHNPRFVKAAA
jgi:hypothetical protein